MRRNLTNLCLALAIVALVTACFCRSQRDSSGTRYDSNSPPPAISSTPGDTEQGNSGPRVTRKEDRGDFVVETAGAATSRFREIDDRVRAEKLLEKAAERLNRSLSLPHDILLRARECGEQNAFYSAKERSITICYELMDRFHRTFISAGATDEKATERMFDAIRFVFLHEVGHALIDVYDLPITANEEDAADRLSAFVNLTELGEDGVRAVFAAADAFAIESKQAKPSKRSLADEHLLQEQRFYNSLCMIYGSDPNKHSNIVTENYLPRERAIKCERDFRRTVDSWGRLLEPWRKS